MWIEVEIEFVSVLRVRANFSARLAVSVASVLPGRVARGAAAEKNMSAIYIYMCVNVCMYMYVHIYIYVYIIYV